MCTQCGDFREMLIALLDKYVHKCAYIHMDNINNHDWQVFKALGEPNRFSLFSQLCCKTEPTTVSELADSAPQDPSVVSRHLKLLKEAGVLLSERKGRETLYQVNAKVLADSLRQLAEVLENCHCCNSTKGGKCCE